MSRLHIDWTTADANEVLMQFSTKRCAELNHQLDEALRYAIDRANNTRGQRAAITLVVRKP